MPRFNADALVKLPHEDMAKAIKHWNQSKMLETEAWSFWRRDNQLPSTEDWRVWLVMAGRGFGKTRMGAEWVSKVALANHGARIALIGATLTEARSVMVEGESGLMNLAGNEQLTWEPSLRKLTWPNGTVATLYSAAEPESLRGPQHDFTWADEIAKWPMGIDGMRVRNVATGSDLVWTGTQWKVPPVMAAPQSGAVIDTEARTVIEALLVHFRAIGLLAP